MKRLFLFALLVSTIGFAQNTATTVLFEYDKFFLTDNAKSNLDAVVSKLELHQLQSVTLNGNTDADGNSKYNVSLSKNRANEVLNYLVSKGIPVEKIELKFDGENKPIAENKSDIGKRQNRRVEVTFIFAEKEYTNTVFAKLEKESQFFTGKSSEVITITGKEGTKITIPKNALLKANGKYAVGTIDIEVKEFYKKSDAVAANLHTMSNGTMLESGGMIYIKATLKGEELQLKKRAEITIDFASTNKEGMETFYGYPKKDQSIDWNTDKDLVIETESNPMFANLTTTYSTFINDKLVSERTVQDAVVLGDTIASKKFKRTTVEAKKTNALDNTLLHAAKLGWINCDKFYDVADKTDVFVAVDLKYKPEIRLVFKDINAIMAGYIDADNKIAFRRIPPGRKATVIAFSCVDNQYYFAMKEIVIEKNGVVDLSPASTTLEEFKTALQQLN